MLVLDSVSGVRRSWSAVVVLTSGVQKGGNTDRERISAIEVKTGGGGGVALNPSHIFFSIFGNFAHGGNEPIHHSSLPF